MSIFIPGSKAGGASTEEVLLTPVEQTTHGFTSSDLGRPVYFDGVDWNLAQADNEDTLQVGVIQEVRDSNNFVVQQGGRIEGVDPNIIDGGGPLVPGNYYRLSEVTAGNITDDAVPVDIINAPVYFALETNIALILPYRADVGAPDVGGATSLDELSDVNVPSPADEQLLTFNNASGKWIAVDASSGGNLGVIQDWGDTEIALGSVGGGQSDVDLDGGHLITATMTAAQTFNFTSTANHTNTTWEMVLKTGGFDPTFQFGGVAITLPEVNDFTVDATYLVSFRKVGSEVYLSERRMA